ncbi:MAG: hypothetical protein AB2598_14605 [Candidatus Thiodiazotropha sp.]
MHSPRRFNIPLEILLEAKKCTKHHACLTDRQYKLCGIRLTSENTSRMVCGKDGNCPYSSQLGKELVCTCPVRHAIHSKYGV